PPEASPGLQAQIVDRRARTAVGGLDSFHHAICSVYGFVWPGVSTSRLSSAFFARDSYSKASSQTGTSRRNQASTMRDGVYATIIPTKNISVPPMTFGLVVSDMYT